jgi:hypothetical protein
MSARIFINLFLLFLFILIVRQVSLHNKEWRHQTVHQIILFGIIIIILYSNLI